MQTTYVSAMCNGDPNASDSDASDSDTSESPETGASKETGADWKESPAAGQDEAQSRNKAQSRDKSQSQEQADARSRPRLNRDGETSQGEAGQRSGNEESGSPAHVQTAHVQPACVRPAHVRLAGEQSPSKQSPGEQRDWDAFAFQHEKLKHLTTVGLVLSGGIITLFQSELMDPSPLALLALVLPVVSSMLTLVMQVSLGNETPTVVERTRDPFGIPVAVHWGGLVALVLLASSIGWLASFFLRDVGLLP